MDELSTPEEIKARIEELEARVKSIVGGGPAKQKRRRCVCLPGWRWLK